MMVAAIIVAAGKGLRAGGPPGPALPAGGPPDRGLRPGGPPDPEPHGSARPDKVLRDLAGQPVIARAVAPFLEESRVGQIIIVAPAGRESEFLDAAFPGGCPETLSVTAVPGGARRQDSVANGLRAVHAAATLVAVHDAARPLHRVEALTRLIDTARVTGAAVPALPVPDTVTRVDPATGLLIGVEERSLLRSVQTPQVFRRDWLEAAHARARKEGIEATDDASLVLGLEHPVAYIPGVADNIKLTTGADFLVAEALLARGKEREA